MNLRTVLMTACAGFALTLAQVASPAAPAVLPADSVYQLPLRLTDQAGRSYDWSTRRGKPQLVSMFYTSCQYICPLIVESGKAMEKHLTPAQQRNLGILLLSMDPARDTPKALQAVVDKRHLDTARWTLASPPPGQVRALAGVLGIRYRQLADGEFNHTSALVLLDARVPGRRAQGDRPLGPQPHRAAAAKAATMPRIPGINRSA
jgi:protein SCO1/2